MYILSGQAGTHGFTSHAVQLEECLQSIKKILAANRLETRDVLKQTVFLKAAGNHDFYTLKKELSIGLKDFYRSFYPPTAFIGQPPIGGVLMAVELVVMTEPDDRVNISRKDLGDIRYITIDSAWRREIYAAGITAGQTAAGTQHQVEGAFRLMKQVLEKENMDFSHVVRQWNYIENITGKIKCDDGTRQNYQVFNDIRSQYYNPSNFKRGYPAATGIGMNCGGVVLEFIAADIAGDKKIIPVNNPDQVDAHRYSREVLVGRAIHEGEKTTPKFERAKAIAVNDSYYVYISGTAAIRGQDVVSPTDVGKQTRLTIENISRLVSPENLEKHGVPVSSSPSTYSHLRVYIKNENHMAEVKKICTKYYGDVPCLCLAADVCRENLLVEIEGAIHVPSSAPVPEP